MSHSYSRRNQDEPESYQCRHILTEGRRCGGVCLRNEEFCYFHHTTRRPVENAAARKARLGTFELVMPEDRSAIQLAIGQVLERVASNDLDPRRAGLLLYGLQIASLNLPRPVAESANMPFVEEIVHDEVLGPIAPRATVEELVPKSESTRLLDELLGEGDYAPVIPEIQAVAAAIPRATSRQPLMLLCSRKRRKLSKLRTAAGRSGRGSSPCPTRPQSPSQTAASHRSRRRPRQAPAAASSSRR